jgi:hypothetical protein
MVSLRQFDRQISLTVVPPFGPGIRVNPPTSFVLAGGAPLIPQLRITFEVRKTITPEPSTAQIEVFNLGTISRDRVSGVIRRVIDFSQEFAFIDGRLITGSSLVPGGTAEKVSRVAGIAYVKLEAGYNGARSQLWSGNGDRVTSRRERVDWVTAISGGDGKLGITQGVSNRSFGAGTPAVVVADYLRTVMGLGTGTVLKPGNPLLPASLQTYVLGRPFVSTGRARDELTALLTLISAAEQENLGQVFPRALEWFVDDGDLFILGPGAVLPLPPVRVSPLPDPTALRLLSTPRRTENDGLEIYTLLAPSLRPGRAVQLLSLEAAGAYRVEEVSHRGDNRGGEFTSTARLRNLAPLPFL